MPKVKWGSGDNAVSVTDLDDWEDESQQPYAGEMPKRGIFQFELTGLKKETSSSGNPKLTARFRLVTRNAQDRQYDGCPLTDFIPVLKSTIWRLRPFMDALGISGREFMNGTVVDDENNVTKIGKKKIGGQRLLIQVVLDDQSGYLNVKRYLAPKPDDDDDDDQNDSAGDDAGSDGDDPF